jgi:hypothetical protein
MKRVLWSMALGSCIYSGAHASASSSGSSSSPLTPEQVLLSISVDQHIDRLFGNRIHEAIASEHLRKTGPCALVASLDSAQTSILKQIAAKQFLQAKKEYGDMMERLEGTPAGPRFPLMFTLQELAAIQGTPNNEGSGKRN